MKAKRTMNTEQAGNNEIRNNTAHWVQRTTIVLVIQCLTIRQASGREFPCVIYRQGNWQLVRARSMRPEVLAKKRVSDGECNLIPATSRTRLRLTVEKQRDRERQTRLSRRRWQISITEGHEPCRVMGRVYELSYVINTNKRNRENYK